MSRPLSLADFPRLPRALAVTEHDGLPAVIDRVAEAAPASHAFLRHQWFAAALRAYGGRAATVVVAAEGVPALAVPVVTVGPAFLRIGQVPGSFWPFRSVPAGWLADDPVRDAALTALAARWRAIRIGPAHADDPAIAPLVARAQAAGWRVGHRGAMESFILDMAALRRAGSWPRNSTLRKNRFHEKHLAAHGALAWPVLGGADWPAGFAALAEVERQSWQAGATDAKFCRPPHATFWSAAAEDPVLAAMFHAALLTIDGRPAAFSFDMDCGATRYAIANSYDPAVARHSPGKLLQYRNLVAAADAGIARVDWGGGDIGYKRVIGAVEGPRMRDWLLVAPRVPAPLAALALRLWRRGGDDRGPND